MAISFFYFSVSNFFFSHRLTHLQIYLIMKSQFEHLPLEIYHTLEEYLTTTDVILLSQTSSYLRSVFGSMSWRTCKLLTDAQVQTSFSDCLHNLVVTPAQSSLPNKKRFGPFPPRYFTIRAGTVGFGPKVSEALFS